MTGLDVTPDPPGGMPQLTAEEQRELPRERPVLVRLLAGLACVAIATAALMFLYPQTTPPASPEENGRELAMNLAPWVLTSPWLRRLDLRRVPCFFVCLLTPLAGLVLVGVVGYRAATLPYRTWRVSYWHEHRARRIPSTRAWVLLGPEAVPAPALSARVLRWERFERIAWVFFMTSAVVFAIWRDLVDSTVGGLWFAALLALAVGPLLVDGLLRIRHPRPGSD